MSAAWHCPHCPYGGGGGCRLRLGPLFESGRVSWGHAGPPPALASADRAVGAGGEGGGDQANNLARGGHIGIRPGALGGRARAVLGTVGVQAVKRGAVL